MLSNKAPRWAAPALPVFILAALAYALYSGLVTVPDRWNPWAPLSIREEPNFLTRYKLARLDDGALCRPVLAQANMEFDPIADRTTGEGCGFRDAVRIRRTSMRVTEPFALSCPSAVALAIWEYHVVQPAALSHYGRKVAMLEHYGSYACRNVSSREGARRSRHATADALDIAGFALEGGRRISIAKSWGGAERDSLFLRELHAGACRFFDGVLGPDYNAAHADHFHVDRGAYRLCR